jgi:flagellin
VAETINVAVSNMSPTGMGVATNFSTVNNLSDANLAVRLARTYRNALTSATVETASISNVSANTNSINKINAINAVTSSSGVTAFGYGNSVTGTDYDPAGVTANVIDGIAAGALVINGISIDAASGGAAVSNTATSLAAAINAKSAEHGVRAEIVSDTDGSGGGTDSGIVLFNRTGAAITVTANSAVDGGITAFFADGTTSVGAGQNGAVILNDTLGDTTLSFSDATDGMAITGVSGATVTLADAAVNAQVITSAGAANLAMLAFTAALDTINSQRATLGAKQNRLESVVANLQNVRENISAARSRVQDADFAEETAVLTRAQILQQAGTAMLAQANALPQNVLTLLRG